MSPARRRTSADPAGVPESPTAVHVRPSGAAALPRGRMPAIGMREIVAAIHRRRERRRETAGELAAALQQLSASVERHLVRVAQLRDAVESQGGDLSHLRHYDNLMARLRAELRAAERSLADAFSSAAHP